MTSPSHKIQDGGRRQGFGDGMSETGFRRQDLGDKFSKTGFRFLLSSAALLLTDQSEFPGFSVTGRLLTWCHNFEFFEPQITACYIAQSPLPFQSQPTVRSVKHDCGVCSYVAFWLLIARLQVVVVVGEFKLRSFLFPFRVRFQKSKRIQAKSSAWI